MTRFITYAILFISLSKQNSAGKYVLCDKCIRKCCGPEQIMVNMTCTRVYNGNFTLLVPIHDGIFYENIRSDFLYNGNDCDNNKFLLYPNVVETDVFYVQENGSIYLPNFLETHLYGPGQYCIDIFRNPKMENILSVIICVGEDDNAASSAAANSSGKKL